ncbi:Zn(2)-Cys(6) binuclear cluster domain-containing protein [Metschnikowia aff. pulcherrima]|uniref:Zn(2)-Cys(6) binuclear cluster domain-containing protein n=1 Tax=Metschnikowia aff. pulcherrima TaxID=2163413 RepID=A0A4P6XUX8_9ASCO|nr:Zn(2)-Cys(6) binuclear cluster domain-containing protein [Metschnikowia aff. pulcherrima]
MDAFVSAPTPLKVFGRGHYACTRCKASKIKCSGEKPACANCKLVDKGHLCHYPLRDRKIVIMESDLNKLQAQLKHMEEMLKLQGPSVTPGSPPDPWPTIQSRDHVPDLPADSYLLADAENDFVPYKLLMLCAHHLPPQFYSVKLINAVCQTYSLEFYLVDGEQIDALVAEIYGFFAASNLLEKSHPATLPPMSPVPLCHFFSLLAFAEQLLNLSLDPLSLSVLVQSPAKKVPGKDFFSIATKLFHLSYEQPSIQFIQSLVILGLFACNLNRYNTVYNFFGVALRSAVANGYHRRMEPPVNLGAEELERHKVYEEKTKRLWWSIFVVDNIWAARMNMPVHIDYTDTDVALPTEGPVIRLKDTYDAESLECNVHLVKYLAKFNKLIYGPNVRTMSVNYITTDSMNQKLLVKNILLCIDDIVLQYEEVTLSPQKKKNMLLLPDRNLANLFLRYNQLIILVVEPLFSLIFDESSAANIEDIDAVFLAISRGVAAATRTVLIFLKLYEYNKLFVLGFWDSRHLFSALMILILASVVGCDSDNCTKAVALLTYMAENNNINAKNYLHKVEVVHGYLNEMPELSLNLDWSCRISDTIAQKAETFKAEQHDVFFNPFAEIGNTLPALFKNLSRNQSVTLLHDELGFHSFSRHTREKLLIISKSIQSWDNYSGLPIHLSGTARCPPMLAPNSIRSGNQSM